MKALSVNHLEKYIVPVYCNTVRTTVMSRQKRAFLLCTRLWVISCSHYPIPEGDEDIQSCDEEHLVPKAGGHYTVYSPKQEGGDNNNNEGGEWDEEENDAKFFFLPHSDHN